MTRGFWLAMGLVALAFAASGYLYLFRFDDLPARVPIHWNLRGEPDGWVARDDSTFTFFLMPGIALATALLSLVLPYLSPRKFEVRDFQNTFDLVIALVVGLLVFMHAIIMLGTFRGGPMPGMDRLMMAGLSAFFVAIALALPRVKRNFWMGVRTPWTLASDLVWQSTHRVAAWTFALAGSAGLLLAALGAPLEWMVAALIAMALIPVVYSLVYYKWLERHGRIDTP